jgi:P27 family predicted phage terminase small subunit
MTDTNNHPAYRLESIPEPPDTLSAGAKQEWKVLSPIIYELQTARPADLRTLELLVELLADINTLQETVRTDGVLIGTGTESYKTHPAQKSLEIARRQAQIMGRPRKPIELHRLSGADKKDPQRYRNKVPKSEFPLGEPPDGMLEGADDAWREITAACAVGVLTRADRLILEITSNLLAEFRSDPPGFASGKMRIMISCFGRLGMSPSDRAHLSVAEKPTGEYDAYPVA